MCQVAEGCERLPNEHVKLARVNHIKMIPFIPLSDHVVSSADMVLTHDLLEQLHLLLVESRKYDIAENMFRQ